jgi:putative ABC transport system substrate-binding protein
MRRREFIGIAGGIAVSSICARAQPASMPVVGFLGNATAAGYAKEITLIREGLNDSGFIEGKNVAFEFRWAHRCSPAPTR